MGLETPDIDIESSDIKLTNIKDYKCAPSKEFQNGSCIPLNILIEMAKAYNKIEKHNPIKLLTKLEMLNPKKYKKYLLTQFKERLDKICDSQRCWVKQKFINQMNKELRDELKNHTFRPEGPKDKFEWLSTFNIEQVLKQYEKKYPEFKFLGAVPIDFDDLPELKIRDLNFDDLIKSGIYKIGIIFNLDEHYKSGSHWVSLYADLKNGTVYFFDSYGVIPERRIRKFVRRIVRYIEHTLKKEPIVDYNRIRHQYDNHSCGVYSIAFIVALLEGRPFEEISKNIKKFNDDIMMKNRDIFFA